MFNAILEKQQIGPVDEVQSGENFDFLIHLRTSQLARKSSFQLKVSFMRKINIFNFIAKEIETELSCIVLKWDIFLIEFSLTSHLIK